MDPTPTPDARIEPKLEISAVITRADGTVENLGVIVAFDEEAPTWQG